MFWDDGAFETPWRWIIWDDRVSGDMNSGLTDWLVIRDVWPQLRRKVWGLKKGDRWDNWTVFGDRKVR